MIKVMGIDPSSHTGVALVSGDKKVLHGIEVDAKKRVGNPRIDYIVGGVFEQIQAHTPDLVVIEEMVVGHQSSAIITVSIGAVIRFVLWQQGIPYLEINPMTLKTFVSGRGQSKKEEMMMHVQRRWGYTSETNNIADAVSLGMAGLACVGADFGVDSRASVVKMMAKIPDDVADHLSALRNKFCN